MIPALTAAELAQKRATAGEGKSAPTETTATKVSKLMLTLVPWEFVEAMAANLQAGLAEYPDRKPHDWQDLDFDFVDEHYRSALLRHYGKREWVAVGVNAAILWWHDRRRRSQERPRP